MILKWSPGLRRLVSRSGRSGGRTTQRLPRLPHRSSRHREEMRPAPAVGGAETGQGYCYIGQGSQCPRPATFQTLWRGFEPDDHHRHQDGHGVNMPMDRLVRSQVTLEASAQTAWPARAAYIGVHPRRQGNRAQLPGLHGNAPGQPHPEHVCARSIRQAEIVSCACVAWSSNHAPLASRAMRVMIFAGYSQSVSCPAER
jgi:hypothetical protein